VLNGVDTAVGHLDHFIQGDEGRLEASIARHQIAAVSSQS
jgi:hypothetical protein